MEKKNNISKEQITADFLTHYDFSAMIGGKLQVGVEKYSRSLLAYNHHIKDNVKELQLEGISVEMNDILDLVQDKKLDSIIESMSLQLINYFDQLRAEVVLLKKMGKFTPKLRDGVYSSVPDDYVGD